MASGRDWLAEVDSTLPQVERLMEALIASHAGALATIAREHLATGGKRLRARLALASVAALEGGVEEAVPWAAACELFHNATLIHDDVQDGDRSRRGQPTVWARHGIPQAINAGDAMLILPFLAVARGPTAHRAALASALARRGCAVIAGQAAELANTEGQQTSAASYFSTASGKTGGLFEMPVEGAALLAGRAPLEATSLAEAFGPLGLLFQLQDDLLDLWGDKGRGEAGADLREGKVSALVVAHLELHPEDRTWLLGLLAAPRAATPTHEVDRAIRCFAEGGARRQVWVWIRDQQQRIAASPALTGAPGLAALAARLVEVILAPIAHLPTD